MTSRFPSACRAFLSELHSHVATADAAVPGHAATCPSCSARLAAARSQERLLRAAGAPAAPSELRSPAFFAKVLERVVEDYEQSTLGEGLQAAMRPLSAPAEMPWPAQEPPNGVIRGAGVEASGAFGLWPSVRQGILHEIHSRGVRRRRLRLAASAAVVLFAVGSIRFFATPPHVEVVPEPVFVRLDSMPIGFDAISPALALKRASQH